MFGVAGSGVDPVIDPGAGAVLQRARLRAQPWHQCRHQRLARVQLQHLPGLRALGYARPPAQPRALLQRGLSQSTFKYTLTCHSNLIPKGVAS
jgi:hypothetical protein